MLCCFPKLLRNLVLPVGGDENQDQDLLLNLPPTLCPVLSRVPHSPGFGMFWGQGKAEKWLLLPGAPGSVWD